MNRNFSYEISIVEFFIRFFILSVLFIPALASAVMPMLSDTIAVKSDGTVVEWGGRVVDPVTVPGLSGVVAVAESVAYFLPLSHHKVALKSDGTVITWGDNNDGQLGDGTVISRPNPETVPGLNGVVAVSAGGNRTVAVKSDGKVVAWGGNDDGQLGDGNFRDRYSPVTIPGLNGAVAVSAGPKHTVVLKSDGTVVTWGDNNFCQLGYSGFRRVPTAVPGVNNVVAVSAGVRETLVLKADGTVVRLGCGSHVVVPDLSGIVAISVGTNRNLALKYDGTVLAWGRMVGDGTTETRHFPVPVPGLNGVVAIDASDTNWSLVLKSDGTVMGWGEAGLHRRVSPEVFKGLNLGAVKPVSDARVFAYAEDNYPNLFPGTGTEGQYQQYHYQYYAFSNTYLAVDTFGNIFIMGPSTNNVITRVGSVMEYANAIIAWEKEDSSRKMN